MKPFRLLSSAASDNAALALNGQCSLTAIIGANTALVPLWLKLYDKRVAPVVADTPLITLYLPASTVFALTTMMQFPSGCGVRITTGSADNDVGLPSLGDIQGLNLVFAG